MDRQKETVFMENQKVRKCKKQLMKQFRLCSQGSLKPNGKLKGTVEKADRQKKKGRPHSS